MKARNYKKSPLKEKPLRQAGQSLDEEISRIDSEKIGAQIALILICILWVFSEWFRWFLKFSFNPFVLTIVAAIIIALSIRKIRGYMKEIKRLRMARDGERVVGQLLEQLRESGYMVFHDIISGNFNIDHVIVGSNGVYTVETKTISKPIKGQSEIRYDGERVSIDGFNPDRDPIIQAKAQANWVGELLQELMGEKVKIQPVVLYPGWFVSQQPNGAEVWVLNEKAFPAFIENERSKLNSKDVHAIAAYLSRYMRNFNREY